MFNDIYLDFVWWEIVSSMHLSINLTNSSFTSPGSSFHFMYPFFFPRRWLLPRSYQYYLVLMILNRREEMWMIPSELICPPPLPFTFMIRWTSAWSMKLENMGQSSISTFGSLHHSACYWHYTIGSASTFSSLRPHAQYVDLSCPLVQASCMSRNLTSTRHWVTDEELDWDGIYAALPYRVYAHELHQLYTNIQPP